MYITASLCLSIVNVTMYVYSFSTNFFFCNLIISYDANNINFVRFLYRDFLFYRDLYITEKYIKK